MLLIIRAVQWYFAIICCFVSCTRGHAVEGVRVMDRLRKGVWKISGLSIEKKKGDLSRSNDEPELCWRKSGRKSSKNFWWCPKKDELETKRFHFDNVLEANFFLSAYCNQTNRYQYIFRYLSVPETSRTLGKCCRSWRHACMFSLPGFCYVLLDLRSNLCRDLNEFWMSNRRWRGVSTTSSISVLLISSEADKLQTFINSQRKLFPSWGFSTIFTQQSSFKTCPPLETWRIQRFFLSLCRCLRSKFETLGLSR